MGKKYSQSTINAKRSKAYRDYYEGNPHPMCRGCGGRAEGTAHIIPQARCKHLGLTELIWNPENFFPSCHKCNSIAENVSSTAILTLRNFETIKQVLEKYDKERAAKLLL